MEMSVSTIQDITLSDLQLLSWDLKLFCREFTIINNLLSNWGLEKTVSQDFTFRGRVSIHIRAHLIPHFIPCLLQYKAFNEGPR